MTRLEHIISTLGEEGGEVAQRCSKANRFGIAEIQPGQPLNNAERILDEVHDFIAMIDMLVDEDVLPADWYPSPERIQRKKDQVERYMLYAREQGVLQ